MKTPPKKKSAGMFRDDQIQNIKSISIRCNEIFDELKRILRKASQQLRDVYDSTPKAPNASPKIKLSKIERMKWPFLQRSTDPLLSELQDAKGTLMVILQVVHLRHAQVTSSLDREEQRDLVRMIAAMGRQQQASSHVGNGGYKGLDAGGTEDSDSDSDSETPSKIYTALEAWSVVPNTVSDETFRRFSITPVPVPQQQIAKVPTQDVDGVALMIDSLSPPEQEAILGGVLGGRLLGPDKCSILSITAQSWKGSHDLFGKVSGRKFNVIIERRVESSKSPRIKRLRIKTRHGPHREAQPRTRMHTISPESGPPIYDSFSDVDCIQDPDYTRGSSHSPRSSKRDRRRPGATHPGTPSGRYTYHSESPSASQRRRPEWERRQAFEEKESLEGTVLREEAKAKKSRLDSEQRTKPQAVSESSDDDFVKSLLTEYTNFDPGEPLVQGFATPPPTYDESFVLPRRDPRPY